MSKLTIDISLDGSQWCALVGANLQEGVAGFGNSPKEAIRALVDEADSQGMDLFDWSL